MSRLFVTAAALAIASMVFAKPETSSGATASASDSGQTNPAPEQTAPETQPTVFGVDMGHEVFPSAEYQAREAAFRSEYPKLSVLIEAAQAKALTPSKLRVTSGVDGFRRGGQRHPFGVQEYPLESFEPAQIEAMLGEQNLTVDLV